MSKLYRVEIYKYHNTPYVPCAANFVNKSYARGFIRGILEHYPCPDMRLVQITPDGSVVEIVEEIKGNSTVEQS